MDVNSFCGMMQTEINFLKARVYDIMQTFEKIKGEKKKEKAAELTDLYVLMEHLSEMNNKLAKTYPLDWSKEKKEIEVKKLN